MSSSNSSQRSSGKGKGLFNIFSKKSKSASSSESGKKNRKESSAEAAQKSSGFTKDQYSGPAIGTESSRGTARIRVPQEFERFTYEAPLDIPQIIPADTYGNDDWLTDPDDRENRALGERSDSLNYSPQEVSAQPTDIPALPIPEDLPPIHVPQRSRSHSYPHEQVQGNQEPTEEETETMDSESSYLQGRWNGQDYGNPPQQRYLPEPPSYERRTSTMYMHASLFDPLPPSPRYPGVFTTVYGSSPRAYIPQTHGYSYRYTQPTPIIPAADPYYSAYGSPRSYGYHDAYPTTQWEQPREPRMEWFVRQTDTSEVSTPRSRRVQEEPNIRRSMPTPLRRSTTSRRDSRRGWRGWF